MVVAALLVLVIAWEGKATYSHQGAVGTWQNCYNRCQSLRQIMPCITSSTSNALLLQRLTSSQEAYVGYSDAANEGDWTWNSVCSSTFSNWNSGEPNNVDDEDYAYMLGSLGGKWNDGKSDYYPNALCFCEGYCYRPTVAGYNLAACASILLQADWNPSCGSCSAGYAGSVMHTVCGSTEASWSVSGCQPFCQRPIALGYDLAACASTIFQAGWNPSCGSCSAGYAGTVTHTVCNSAGASWSVSGCHECVIGSYVFGTSCILCIGSSRRRGVDSSCTDCRGGLYDDSYDDCVECIGSVRRRRAVSCTPCPNGTKDALYEDDCQEPTTNTTTTRNYSSLVASTTSSNTSSSANSTVPHISLSRVSNASTHANTTGTTTTVETTSNTSTIANNTARETLSTLTNSTARFPQYPNASVTPFTLTLPVNTSTTTNTTLTITVVHASFHLGNTTTDTNRTAVMGTSASMFVERNFTKPNSTAMNAEASTSSSNITTDTNLTATNAHASIIYSNTTTGTNNTAIAIRKSATLGNSTSEANTTSKVGATSFSISNATVSNTTVTTSATTATTNTTIFSINTTNTSTSTATWAIPVITIASMHEIELQERSLGELALQTSGQIRIRRISGPINATILARDFENIDAPGILDVVIPGSLVPDVRVTIPASVIGSAIKAGQDAVLVVTVYEVPTTKSTPESTVVNSTLLQVATSDKSLVVSPVSARITYPYTALPDHRSWDCGGAPSCCADPIWLYWDRPNMDVLPIRDVCSFFDQDTLQWTSAGLCQTAPHPTHFKCGTPHLTLFSVRVEPQTITTQDGVIIDLAPPRTQQILAFGKAQELILAAVAADPEKNRTTMQTTDGVTVVLQKLPRRVIMAREKEFEVEVGDYSIGLPANLLQTVYASVSPDVDSLAVMVMVFADGITSKSITNQRWNTNSLEGGPLRLDLLFLQPILLQVEVRALKDPITLFIPTETKGNAFTCMFWNDSSIPAQWSPDGMATKSSAYGKVHCETSHLSIFGVILSELGHAIACSTASVLTAEGIANLTRGYWWRSHAMACMLVLVLMFLLLMALACRWDRAWAQQGLWKDEFFFVAESVETTRGRPSWVSAISGGLLDHVQVNAARKFTEKKEYVLHHLDFVKRPITWLEDHWLEALSGCILSANHGVHVNDIHDHIWKGGSWKSLESFQSPVLRSKIEAAIAAGPNLLEYFFHRSTPIWTRTLILFQASQPWCQLNHFSLTASSALRTNLLFAEIFGSVFAGSLFFSSSGLAVQFDVPKECIPSSDFRAYVRDVIIGYLSTFVSAWPLAIMLSFRKRHFHYAEYWSEEHIRNFTQKWLWQDRFLMCLVSCVNVFFVFFAAAFLANVTSDDYTHWLWATTAAMAETLFLTPLKFAFFMSLVATIMAHFDASAIADSAVRLGLAHAVVVEDESTRGSRKYISFSLSPSFKSSREDLTVSQGSARNSRGSKASSVILVEDDIKLNDVKLNVLEDMLPFEGDECTNFEATGHAMPKSVGDAASVCFIINNVDHQALLADAIMFNAFTSNIRQTIASEVGRGVEPAHVELQLSQGSLEVIAQVRSAIDVFLVQSVLHASDSLSVKLTECVRSVPGIAKVSIGAITVSNISIPAFGSTREDEKSDRSRPSDGPIVPASSLAPLDSAAEQQLLPSADCCLGLPTPLTNRQRDAGQPPQTPAEVHLPTTSSSTSGAEPDTLAEVPFPRTPRVTFDLQAAVCEIVEEMLIESGVRVISGDEAWRLLHEIFPRNGSLAYSSSKFLVEGLGEVVAFSLVDVVVGTDTMLCRYGLQKPIALVAGFGGRECRYLSFMVSTSGRLSLCARQVVNECADRYCRGREGDAVQAFTRRHVLRVQSVVTNETIIHKGT